MRAPKTSKVSMTGNVPPVSYVAPVSSRRRQYPRTHRANHSPRINSNPRTHRAHHSTRINSNPIPHRAQNSPRTSPRTYRTHHSYTPEKTPFNDTDTIVNAMLQHYIYVFTEYTITENEDNTITMNYKIVLV